MLAIHAEHGWKIRESEKFYHASMIHAEHGWKIRESAHHPSIKGEG
jgi:hypothetical protein